MGGTAGPARACAPHVPAWRPLRGWSQSQLQSACQRLDTVQAAWSLAWGLSAPAGGCTARAAGAADLHLATWVALTTSDGEVRAWMGDTMLGADLRRILWGDVPAGPLAAALGGQCAADLQSRLASLLGLIVAPSPSRGPTVDDVAPWSGAVLVEQALAPRRQLLLLSAEAIDPLIPRVAPQRSEPAALVGLDEALRNRRLALQVRLAGCTVDLGALAGLRIDDVVRLDHGLQQPATVTDGQGRPCFAAHLARRGDRKAIVLAPLASVPKEFP
ncbi:MULTISPECIES: FliM/FliN family flagellar motor C-terminal domain-containing protein [Ramlibacter]|uniref:FliM/FliN family flagellar motor switch protein n=1 Tax=Ramlibacter pinisoli TaxID=2682844 RepID=A0A6N8IS65_9BURK|nr:MULTISPECIES: FliM/FliN family flagellar motor C-terminal domain-containing protein [Ramlibacter]MBA2964776.1 hypothetical protein [Ramlibacter sp. CGMCC 1.13660]MVQ29741.1 hypothetical protein [Ramlibacter pinisoli]